MMPRQKNTNRNWKTTSFAVTALFFACAWLFLPPAQAQINVQEIVKDGIQNETPQWLGGKEPLWNTPVLWRPATHMDYGYGKRQLRDRSERGDKSAESTLQARKLVAEKKYDQAIAAYKRAAELGWTAYEEWGDLLEAKGDYAGAVRVYRELIYGSGFYRDNNDHIIPAPYDWQENGRSLRETLQQKPISGRPSSGTVMPNAAMRYALLLVKGKHYDEAVQVRKWCIEAIKGRWYESLETHQWLREPFTAETVRADPSLFIAQAWSIIGLYDTVRRTDDLTGITAIIRLKKAVAIRPDFAPAWFELAERYRALNQWSNEPEYAALAKNAYQNVQTLDTTGKALSLIKATGDVEKDLKREKQAKNTLYAKASRALAVKDAQNSADIFE